MNEISSSHRLLITVYVFSLSFFLAEQQQQQQQGVIREDFSHVCSTDDFNLIFISFFFICPPFSFFKTLSEQRRRQFAANLEDLSSIPLGGDFDN